MFCTNCGVNMPDGAKFCNSCGTAAKQIQPAATAVVQTDAGQGAGWLAESDANSTQFDIDQAARFVQPETAPVNAWFQEEGGTVASEAPSEAPSDTKKDSVFVGIILPIVVMIALALVFSFVLFLILDTPAENIAPILYGERMTGTQLDQFILDFGLDKPLVVRYARAMMGDFGMSYLTKLPVDVMIIERLPTTLKLLLISFVVTFVFAVPIGIVSARYKDTVVDVVFSSVSLLCKSIPFFFIAYLLISWLSVDLMLLPVAGLNTWEGYILPVITLGFLYFGFAAQTVRATVIKMRSGGSAGVFFPGPEVRGSRPLMSAILPAFAKSGLQLGWMVGGIIVIEIFFALPGVASLILTSIQSRDVPVLFGSIISLTACFLLISVVGSLITTGVLNIFRIASRK